MPSLFDSIMEALNEKILWVIAIFAILSIISGVIYNPQKGWIEGVSILVALFILVLISSFMDITKDQTFVKLQQHSLDEDMHVIRGKKGTVQSCSIWNLVVGDIVHLSAGDKVPSDCIIVDGQQVLVEQPDNPHADSLEEGDREEKRKYKNNNNQSVEDHKDVFLYADSYII